jgi:hypothetical protein
MSNHLYYKTPQRSFSSQCLHTYVLICYQSGSWAVDKLLESLEISQLSPNLRLCQKKPYFTYKDYLHLFLINQVSEKNKSV